MASLASLNLREAQLLRGATTVRMVASRTTVRSLEKVALKSLPVSERSLFALSLSVSVSLSFYEY
jgi:hypothetical protein